MLTSNLKGYEEIPQMDAKKKLLLYFHSDLCNNSNDNDTYV